MRSVTRSFVLAVALTVSPCSAARVDDDQEPVQAAPAGMGDDEEPVDSQDASVQAATTAAPEVKEVLTTPGPRSETDDQKAHKYIGKHPSVAGWIAGRDSLGNGQRVGTASLKAKEAKKFAQENPAPQVPEEEEPPNVCPCATYLKAGTISPADLGRCIEEHKCGSATEILAAELSRVMQHTASAQSQAPAMLEEPDSAVAAEAPQEAAQAAQEEETDAVEATREVEEEVTQERPTEEEVAQQVPAQGEVEGDAAEASGETYCTKGYDTWHTTWSGLKKKYCCKHFQKGCEPDKCPCGKFLAHGKIFDADYEACVRIHHCHVHRGVGAKHILTDEVDFDQDKSSALKRNHLHEASGDTAKVIARVAKAAGVAAADAMRDSGSSEEAAKRAEIDAIHEVERRPTKDLEVPGYAKRVADAGGAWITTAGPSELQKAANEVDEVLAAHVAAPEEEGTQAAGAEETAGEDAEPLEETAADQAPVVQAESPAAPEEEAVDSAPADEAPAEEEEAAQAEAAANGEDVAPAEAAEEAAQIA